MSNQMVNSFKNKRKMLFSNIIEIKRAIENMFSVDTRSIKENAMSIRCPYCEDKKHHLGLNFELNAYNCFRCSKSGRLDKFLKKHNVPFSSYEINEINKKQDRMSGEISLFKLEEEPKPVSTFTLPSDKEVHKGLLSKFDSYLKYRGINKDLVREKVRFYPITDFSSEYYGYIIVPIEDWAFYGRSYVGLPYYKQKHIIRKAPHMIGTPTYLFIDDNKSDTIVVVESFFNLLKLIQNGYSALCTFGKTNIRSVEEFLKKTTLDKNRKICFCYDSDVPITEIHGFLKKLYKNCNIENQVTFIHPHSMRHNDLAEYGNNELKKFLETEQINAEQIFVNLFLPKYVDFSQQ